MRIIITGATGSLGAFLTRYFSKKGHEIIAYGRNIDPQSNLFKYATFKSADICQPFEMPDADVCIHTAALSDDKVPLRQLMPHNVTGTKNVLKASAACSTFIHVSSSSVYLPSSHPITESMAGNQNNKLLSDYGTSKLLAEEIVKENYSHNSCFILRPRAFYGAGDRVILPRVLKLVNKNVFSRPGKMNIKVSLTHYENIAHAIELAIDSKKKGIHIYNVADDETYVFVEAIRKLTEHLYGKTLNEKEIKIWFLRLLGAFRVGGITPLLVRSFTKDMVLDITKIKSELGYKAVTNFYEKLPEVASWVKSIGGVDKLKTGDRELAWL